MSLVSFEFFCFLLISLIVFYCVGGKAQKYVLLAGNLFFFVSASGEKALSMGAILALVIGITYGGARLISAAENRKRTLCMGVVISLLVVNLMALKQVYNIGALLLGLLRLDADISWLNFAAPIGVSYFTLSAIGYLIEVYWGNYPAEKNFAVVADFVGFFPTIISGPVLRFGEMSTRFKEKHCLRYEDIRLGLLRMLWGYFKKLVVADRLAPVVQIIYAYYDSRNSLVLWVAVFAYMMQLYADFSGCMDIIMGAARMFGIVLPENFDSPFYSQSISEFWRRWHITLGNWFKDFVMYPVLKTKKFVSLGKKAKKKLGKNLGKKVPTYLSLLILWSLLGLWHGGIPRFFMASAVVPCTYLILGDLLEPAFTKLRNALHIKEENPFFMAFRMLRTVVLIGISWIFSNTVNVADGFDVMGKLVTNLGQPIDIWTVFSQAGMGTGRFCLLLGAVLLVLLVDFLEYREISVLGLLEKLPTIFRWLLIYAVIACVVLYGAVGTSSFIYFQF